MAELKRLATSAAFTGNCKAKAQNYKQGGKEKSRNEEPGDLRSADGAWVPSATIFLRVELPIVKPALARSVLTSADAGDNGFIPLECLQHGLVEVASDLVCLPQPQMIMTASGRRDVVPPVDVAL